MLQKATLLASHHLYKDYYSGIVMASGALAAITLLAIAVIYGTHALSFQTTFTATKSLAELAGVGIVSLGGVAFGSYRFAELESKEVVFKKLPPVEANVPVITSSTSESESSDEESPKSKSASPPSPVVEPSLPVPVVIPDLEKVLLNPMLDAIKAVCIAWNQAAYFSYYSQPAPQDQTDSIEHMFVAFKKWGKEILKNPKETTSLPLILLSFLSPGIQLVKMDAMFKNLKAEHARQFAQELSRFAADFDARVQLQAPLKNLRSDDSQVHALLQQLGPIFESSQFTFTAATIPLIPDKIVYHQKELVKHFYNGMKWALHYGLTDNRYFRDKFRSASKEFSTSLVQGLSKLGEDTDFQKVIAVFCRECQGFVKKLA